MTDFKNYTIDDFRKQHQNHKLADVEQRRLKLATTQASATLQAYAALIKSFEEQVKVEKPDYKRLFMSGENLDKASFIFDIKNYEADLKTYATNYLEETDAEFKEDNKEKTDLVMEYLNNDQNASLDTKINLFVQMTKDMASYMIGRDNINKVAFPSKYAKDEKNFYLGGLKISGFYNSYKNFMGGADETTTKKIFRQLGREAALIYSYNGEKMDYEYSVDGAMLNYKKLDSAGDPVDDFGMITSGVDKIMVQSKSGKELNFTIPEGASISRKALERGVLYDIEEVNGKSYMLVNDSRQPISDSNIYYVIEGAPSFSVEAKKANDIKIVEYMNDGSIYSQIKSGLRGDDLLTNVLDTDATFEESMIKRLDEIGFQEFLFADHRENLDDVETVGAVIDGVSAENTDKFTVTIGGLEGMLKNHIGSFTPSLYIKKSFLNSVGGINEANPNLDADAPFWHGTRESIDVANTVRAFLQIEPQKLAANNSSEIVEKTQASISLGSRIAYESAINYFPDYDIPEDMEIESSNARDWKAVFKSGNFFEDIKDNANYNKLAEKYFSFRIGEMVEAYSEFSTKTQAIIGKNNPGAPFDLNLSTIDEAALKPEAKAEFEAAFKKLQNAFIGVQEQKILNTFKDDPLFKKGIFDTTNKRDINVILASLGELITNLAAGKTVSKVFESTSILFPTNFIKYKFYSSNVKNDEVERLFNDGDKASSPSVDNSGAKKDGPVDNLKGISAAGDELKYALLALVSKINMAEQLGTPEDNANITANVRTKLMNLIKATSNTKTGASFLDSIDIGYASTKEHTTASLIKEFKDLSRELDEVKTSAEVAIRKSVDPFKKIDFSSNPDFGLAALGLKNCVKDDQMITFVTATGGVGKTEIAKLLKLLNVIDVIGIENRDENNPLDVENMVKPSITDGKRMYKKHDVVYKNALGGILAGKGVAVIDELAETASQYLASSEIGTGPKVDAMNKASGRDPISCTDICGVTNKYENNGLIIIGNYLNELANDAAINRRTDTLTAGAMNRDYYTKEGVLKMMRASLLRPVAGNLSAAASKENVAKTMAHKEELLERTMASHYPSLSDSELRTLTSILKKAINEAGKTQAIDPTKVFLRNDGESEAERVRNDRKNINVAGVVILNELYKSANKATSEMRSNIDKVANIVGKMLQTDAGKQEFKSFTTTVLTDNIYANAVAKRVYNNSYSNPLDEVSKVSKKYIEALTSEAGQAKRENALKDIVANMKNDSNFKNFIEENIGESAKIEAQVSDVASKIKSRNEALLKEINNVEENILQKTGETTNVYYATAILNSQISEVIGTGNELALYENIIDNIAAKDRTKFDAQLELAAQYMARYNELSKLYLDEARSKQVNREKGYNPDAYPITPWPSLARLAGELARNPNMVIEPATIMDSFMKCAPNDAVEVQLKGVLEKTVREWSLKHNANIQKVNFSQASMA